MGSYFATRWVIDKLNETPAQSLADLNYTTANAYREARRDLMLKLHVDSWNRVPMSVQLRLKNAFTEALKRNATVNEVAHRFDKYFKLDPLTLLFGRP